MNHLLEKYPRITLLLLCSLLFLVHLDVLYVNIMEARNFIAAREMWTHDHWILTTLNEFPRYEKPPLPTWLTAFSGKLSGMESLWALRLPAALLGILGCLSLYDITVTLTKDKKLGFYAGAVLATSFYMLFSSRNGQWDIFTHGFMMAGLGLAMHAWHKRQPSLAYWGMAGLCMGASILSKGPVSLYALWLPACIAWWVSYRGARPKGFWAGFTLMLSVGILTGVSWYLYVRLEDPTYFLEITSEETANWGSYNVRPFYYYWSFFTQSGLWTIPALLSLAYPWLRNKIIHKKAYQFSFWWTITAVILLSVIPEKKSRYLLPVLFPLAMNTALFLQYLWQKEKHLPKGWRIPILIHHIVLILVALLFIPAALYFKEWYPNSSTPRVILTGLGLLGAATGMILSLRKGRYELLWKWNIFYVMVIVAVGFPLSKNLYVNPNFQSPENYISKELPLYSFSEPAPEMIWELRRPAPNFLIKDSLLFPNMKEFGVLVPIAREKEFTRIFEPAYWIEFQTDFDLNYTASPGQKNYKDRLVSRFYILSQKNNTYDYQN